MRALALACWAAALEGRGGGGLLKDERGAGHKGMREEEAKGSGEFSTNATFGMDAWFSTNAWSQRYMLYDPLPQTKVVLLTHLTDDHARGQVAKLDAAFGSGRALAFADLAPAEQNPTGYVPAGSVRYSQWTDDDETVLQGFNRKVPRGGLLLGRALQLLEASDADYAWLLEHDVDFGETGQHVKELVERYADSKADLIDVLPFTPEDKPDWMWWRELEDRGVPQPWRGGFQMVTRVSRAMVQALRRHVAERKEALFLEAFLPTVAAHAGLEHVGLDADFTKYLHTGHPCWTAEAADPPRTADMRAHPDGKLFHPAKWAGGGFQHFCELHGAFSAER